MIRCPRQTANSDDTKAKAEGAKQQTAANIADLQNFATGGADIFLLDARCV
jgi:hypothetical protein